MALNARLEYAKESSIPLTMAQEQARLRIFEQFDSGFFELEEVPCYCGEQDGHVIAERDRYGFKVRTVLCMRCGLLRTTPRMTAASTAAFYRNDYRALYTDGCIDLETFHQSCIWRGNEVIRHMPGLLSRVHTIFDIGCASGGILESFASIGKQVSGCDMNRRYLDFGRARGLDLVEGEVEDLLRKTGIRADLAILFHVMEHFLDLKAELEKTVSAVRENGFILINVPTIETVKDEYGGDLLRYFQNAHTYHFSAATLRYVLESIGLNVISVQSIGWALAERPAGWMPGQTHEAQIPPNAAMENLSLLLKYEAAFESGRKR